MTIPDALILSRGKMGLDIINLEKSPMLLLMHAITGLPVDMTVSTPPQMAVETDHAKGTKSQRKYSYEAENSPPIVS